MFQFENIKISINETKNKDRLQYVCLNNEDGNTRYIEGPLPLALNTRNELVQYLISNTNLKRFNKESKDEELDKIYKSLYIEYENSIAEKEAKARKEETDRANAKQENIRQGKELFDTTLDMIEYIKQVTHWLTAGETKNILFAFVGYASEVLFKSGINIIPVGDASSGKNHIEEVALGFIPEENVIMEKDVTPAVIFRRSEIDINFYDGKIVRYGDMGGTYDVENVQQSMNLMKELESEGYLNKPVNIQESGSGWVPKDLELKGTPSVTFTTVPNKQIDSQILSRGLTLMPRTDNRDIYHNRARILAQQGKSKKYIEKTIKPACKDIRNVIRYLAKEYADVIIINPYYDSISKLVSGSYFYKRDSPKYETLLKVISVLNAKRKVEYNGKEYIIVTRKDVNDFFNIIEDYIDIANSSLTKGAMNCLVEFINLSEVVHYENGLPEVEANTILSKREFMDQSELNYSKKSVSNYFTELVNNDYLQVEDDTTSKQNYYSLTKRGKTFNKINNILCEPYWDNLEHPEELIQKLKAIDIPLDNEEKIIYFDIPRW